MKLHTMSCLQRRAIAALALALAVTALSACGASTRRQWRFESFKLKEEVALTSADVVVVTSDWSRESGRLNATVRVKNMSTGVVLLRYRFVWLDQARVQVGEQDSRWQDLELRSQEVAPLEGTTPAKGAVDFVLEFE